MVFAFTPSKPTGTKLLTTTSGSTPVAWLMFGANGAVAIGKGRWVELEGVEWKSFMLRRHATPHNGTLAAASVEIHVANELDPADADANTKFVVAGTLNAGAPSLLLEVPWRFVRAELKVAGGGSEDVQVDFHGIGV